MTGGSITSPLFRRPPAVGTQSIDGRTVARIEQVRTAPGFARAALGGDSLKHGALSTNMDLACIPPASNAAAGTAATP